jgi:hypothetical protein
VSLILNPGAGDVPGATYNNAARNINTFMDDLRKAHGYTEMGVVPRDHTAERGGRWLFVVTCTVPMAKAPLEQWLIDMPGLPLDQVRYTGPPMNPFDFPRLYVDGSSWLWKFAVDICAPS